MEDDEDDFSLALGQSVGSAGMHDIDEEEFAQALIDAAPQPEIVADDAVHLEDEDFSFALASVGDPAVDSAVSIPMWQPTEGGSTTATSRALFQVGGRLLTSKSGFAMTAGAPKSLSTATQQTAAYAYRSYVFARSIIMGCVRHCIRVCQSATAPGDTGDDREDQVAPEKWQAAVYVRTRKYDSTPGGKLRCFSESNDNGMLIVDTDVSKKAKLFVTEAKIRMGMRHIPTNRCVQCICDQPTLLQMLEQGRGDDIHQALKELDLGTDDEVRRSFLREIDVVIADDDGANHRRERHNDTKNTRRSRGRVQIRCTTHKKVAIVKQLVPVSDGMDTYLIQLCLALEQTPRSKSLLRQAIRNIIAEQLTCIDQACSPVTDEDDEHRTYIYGLYLDPEDSMDAARSTTAHSLFNGRITRCGVVAHIEKGCCSSPMATLRSMQTYGVDVIMPRVIPLIDRKGWNGMELTLRTVGVGVNVHFILPQAILRVLQTQSKSTKAQDADADRSKPDAGVVASEAADGDAEVDGVPVSIYKLDIHVPGIRYRQQIDPPIFGGSILCNHIRNVFN